MIIEMNIIIIRSSTTTNGNNGKNLLFINYKL